MRLRFFSVPVNDSSEAEAEVNDFLGSHRVLRVARELASEAGGAVWAICVEYLEGVEPLAGKAPAGRRIDYREIMDPADFAVFAQLRTLRNDVAKESGVPAYALFTNEQLAEMVTRRVRTKEALGAIRGIGPSRVEKYAERFLPALNEAFGDDPNDGGGDAAT